MRGRKQSIHVQVEATLLKDKSIRSVQWKPPEETSAWNSKKYHQKGIQNSTVSKLKAYLLKRIKKAFSFRMDPTPVQREPLPNQVGGNAEYFIRATVDASNYINLLDGNSKTFFVDSFAVRTDVNDYFLQFQITATLRNTGGEYYTDVYMSPINAVLIHLSASVQVWKIFEKLHVNLQTHFAFKYRVPQQVWNWLNVLKLKIVFTVLFRLPAQKGFTQVWFNDGFMTNPLPMASLAVFGCTESWGRSMWR